VFATENGSRNFVLFHQACALKRLLIRPGGIGDFIVSLPALECLRADYTELWAASQNLSLARFADTTASLASTGIDLLGLEGVVPPARLLDRLRGFDSIVSWYGSNRPEFQETVHRMGLPFEFLQAVPPQDSEKHAADFYMDQAHQLTGRVAEAIPRLDCPTGKREFVVIHPFSGSPMKNWPLERYKQLAGTLADICLVRWCAGPGEVLENAVRIEDLYELACWLACARLYIGNDSGITHLAAAAGTPVLCLFGPTDPSVWGPRGRSVRIISAGPPGSAIDNLKLEVVLSAVLEMLGSQPTAGKCSGLPIT